MFTIDGYSEFSQVHEGQKSIVFRAIRDRDRKPVVIKFLRNQHPSTRDVVGFKQQYDLTRNLNLEGVVKSYGLEEFGDGYALILEDFQGESLKELLRREPLSLNQFLELAIPICNTLGQVHGKDIIHKDIKPSNIFFNKQTGEVKLADFGIASLLPREQQQLIPTPALEGTLAYMSPEQTGRMNRSIDYRSDLYSLGVTFYEMVCGRLPFDMSDPIEIIHCHIAKQPLPPHIVDPKLPQGVSDIIMKLLSKTPEDRYKSAYGVKADLQVCLEQLAGGKPIEVVPGERDVQGKFHVSQRLYGRDAELDILLKTFDRVRDGRSELLLVGGYAGIGKSALIREIHKPIVRDRGYFISGKFDQFKKNIPYSAMIQAFQELLLHLLTETEDRIEAWKHLLLSALGPNGQVIIDVIPEVELIIGRQPPVPSLPPTESQNRFNIVFRDFVRVFAKPEHPLAIFIDDLQWADAGTLKMIELLTTDTDTRHLFLIGAYRDNEVSPWHSLSMTVEQIKGTGTPVHTMTLGPLDRETLSQLLADTLWTPRQEVSQLAELIDRKTNGNPFFVNELLQTLHRNGSITFDEEKATWTWSLEKINRIGITDNVADLMIGKIEQLPAASQDVLKLAACIGNRFDLHTLSIVYQKSPSETCSDLWESLQQELINPVGETATALRAFTAAQGDMLSEGRHAVSFQFLHDRVQQAAYSLIAEDARQAVHLKIGRLLLSNTSEADRDDHLFDLVDHLNEGGALIESDQERVILARLNLSAGQKAKGSTAYEPALQYIDQGLGMLGEQGWHNHYELALPLHMEKMACEQLNLHYDESQRVFHVILDHARSQLDAVAAYCALIEQYTSQDRAQDAIQAGMEAFRLLGVKRPPRGSKFDIAMKMLVAKWRLRKRSDEAILEAPEMTDADTLMTQRVAEMIGPPSYYVDPNLLISSTLMALNLSLKYGFTRVSPINFMIYAMALGPAFGKYDESERFWKLALRLQDRFQATELAPKLYMLVGHFLNHWTAHAKTCLPFLSDGYQRALEVGDYLYGSYCGLTDSYYSLMIGMRLDDVLEKTERYLQFARKTEQQPNALILISTRQFVLNLTGATKGRQTFDTDDHDDEAHHAAVKESSLKANVYWHGLLRAQSLFLFERWGEALEVIELIADEAPEKLFAILAEAEFNFYHSLILIQAARTATHHNRKKYLKQAVRNQKRMKQWMQHAPENFEHKFFLVAAELAGIEKAQKDAMDLYEKAISSAHDNDYMQNEALANELAAKFYASIGIETSARAYLANARYRYERWGATEKVRQLNETYSNLLPQGDAMGLTDKLTVAETSTETSHSFSKRIDLSAMMYASQTLSGESVLGELLEKIMKIALQNAGAERGYLVLERDGHFIIEAEGTVDPEHIDVLQSHAINGHHGLSEAIINYVARTKENVVLRAATREGLFTKDAYIEKAQPKSVLCVPIVFQGKLKGMLYLENNLATGAFTPERLEVLTLLASQAAMAIGQAESTIDTLTRSWVRRYFMERAEEEIATARRRKQSLCVLMIDLDHFKQKNDTYGHLTGDIILRETASRLRSVLRDEDCMGRFGGEEFVLLLPGTNRDAAKHIAERMRTAVDATSIEAEGHHIAQTISIGLAVYPQNGEDLETLIASADRALYDAKRGGRNKTAMA